MGWLLEKLQTHVKKLRKQLVFLRGQQALIMYGNLNQISLSIKHVFFKRFVVFSHVIICRFVTNNNFTTSLCTFYYFCPTFVTQLLKSFSLQDDTYTSVVQKKNKTLYLKIYRYKQSRLISLSRVENSFSQSRASVTTASRQFIQ